MDDSKRRTGVEVLVSVLAQAIAIATKEVDAHPLDLNRIDLCLGLAVVHSQAAGLMPTTHLVDLAASAEDVDLRAALEHSERVARELIFTPDVGDSNDLVLALCDLVREARALA